MYFFTASARRIGSACIFASAILVACSSSSPDHGAVVDAASGAPSNGSAGGDDSGFPQCSATQLCVGYPSAGDWVCLERCTGVGRCPSGMTCLSAKKCCSGAGCIAARVSVCGVPDAGAGEDGASDAPNDDSGDDGASDASIGGSGDDGAPDAPNDGSGDDGDSGFPQCTGTQHCVGYRSPGDWVCLDGCSGPDAGDCPSGMACTGAVGCCAGAGCRAPTYFVCVGSDGGASGDGSPDAPNDASAGDAPPDAPNDGSADGDGGFPQCTGTQRCVGYPSPGDWVCLETCSGPDAGGCSSGTTCRSASGCCSGTGCSAISEYVCVTP